MHNLGDVDYSIISVDRRHPICFLYIYLSQHEPPVLSTRPLYTNSGSEKERGAYELVHGDPPAKAAPVWNYLEVYTYTLYRRTLGNERHW